MSQDYDNEMHQRIRALAHTTHVQTRDIVNLVTDIIRERERTCSNCIHGPYDFVNPECDAKICGPELLNFINKRAVS